MTGDLDASSRAAELVNRFYARTLTAGRLLEICPPPSGLVIRIRDIMLLDNLEKNLVKSCWRNRIEFDSLGCLILLQQYEQGSDRSFNPRPRTTVGDLPIRRAKIVEVDYRNVEPQLSVIWQSLDRRTREHMLHPPPQPGHLVVTGVRCRAHHNVYVKAVAVFSSSDDRWCRRPEGV